MKLSKNPVRIDRIKAAFRFFKPAGIPTLLFFGLGIVGPGLSGHGAGQEAWAQAADPQREAVNEAVWRPDPKMARYLGRHMTVRSYSIQPPAAYTARQTQRSGTLVYSWLGREPETGVTPSIAMALTTAPFRSNKKLTAEQVLGSALTTLQNGHADWTQTEIEHGQINGLSFVRAHWTGTERMHKRKMRGVSYVAIDGPYAISFVSQDIAASGKASGAETSPDANATSPDTLIDTTPNTVDRLKLAEAAILTLHRVAAPKKEAPPAPMPSTQ